jgi:carbon monoxide dehydrogenase subunit G
MDFEHSFTIPVPPATAWDVLLDVERVAPCMPGASVDKVDGDDVSGRVRVKVGPITMTYAGHARFIDRNPEARTVTIEASGKEARGTGTASATVHAALSGEDGKTTVTMNTTLNVTGRPAQMGRGVLADVSSKLVERFAANLAAQLSAQTDGGGTGTPPTQAGEAGTGGAATSADAGAPTDTTRTGQAAAFARKTEDEALNLLHIAAGPVMKRIIPAVGALLVAAGIWLVSLFLRKRKNAS